MELIALNAGLKLARSPLIARMDADDVSYAGRLPKQYSFLKSNRIPEW
ncbi:glycosyltransferase [Roseivirga sp. BDSF3-8]